MVRGTHEHDRPAACTRAFPAQSKSAKATPSTLRECEEGEEAAHFPALDSIGIVTFAVLAGAPGGPEVPSSLSTSLISRDLPR